MIVTIGRNVCEKLYHMQVKREEPKPVARAPRKTTESGGGSGTADASGSGQGASDESKPVRRSEPKVGRNDPCPCGSGKKYKKCHGAQAA